MFQEQPDDRAHEKTKESAACSHPKIGDDQCRSLMSQSFPGFCLKPKKAPQS
jgi:hypothetical protein